MFHVLQFILLVLFICNFGSEFVNGETVRSTLINLFLSGLLLLFCIGFGQIIGIFLFAINLWLVWTRYEKLTS